MEVISIEGVDYIKASNIAKQFKYTADYVGQLCRGRKVDAKLIGRTWYVNPLSLNNHKAQRHNKDLPDEIVEEETTNIEISRPVVNPGLNKNTVKVLSQKQESNNYAKRIGWKPITYKEDDTDLLPPLATADKQSTKLHVDTADASKLTINDDSKLAIDLESEPLPEFPLTGNLKVSSADSYFENNEENIAIPENGDEITDVTEVKPQIVLGFKRDPARQNLKVDAIAAPQSKTAPVFTPSLVLNKTAASPALPIETPENASIFVGWVFWFMLVTFLLIAAALLTVDQTISATAAGSTHSFIFTLPTELF